MKNSFSSPAFLWPLLTLICLSLVMYGLNIALKRTAWSDERRKKIFLITGVSLVLWIALLSVLSLNGFFADFSKLPPRPALAVLIPLPVMLAVAFSKTGTQVLTAVLRQWLVYLQSFRIFVELLLWFAFLANKLPVQMTFEGKNFDVLTGILALPVGYFCFVRKSWPQAAAVAYNILGMVLLLNILIVAILSMPTSLRYFMNEPANVLVAEFPYILLPGVLVPLAYTLHIFSLRQLLYHKRAAKVAVL